MNSSRAQSGTSDDASRAHDHLADDSVCACGVIVRNQRWVLEPALVQTMLATGTAHQVECPACRKAHDHLPQGILTLRGDYWPAHRDDLLNLVRNQETEARQDNPLERILSLREEDGALVVETTNEKLAQKIGRSIQKAHKGEIDYRWSDGNRLVRVDWVRAL